MQEFRDNRDQATVLPRVPVLAPAAAVTLPEDSGLGALSAPRGWTRTAVLDARKSQPRSTETPSTAEVTPAPAPQRSVGTILKLAAGSAALWSGVGASVVCLDSSIVGVLGHGLATLWTVRNEVRLRTSAHPAESDAAPRPASRGYLGLIKDAVNSPGFNKIAAGLTYLAAGIEAGFHGHLLQCAVFSEYFIGCMTLTAVLNQAYTGTRTDRTLPERAFRAAWDALPSRLQTLLKDPGLYMTIGNSSLVVGTLNLKNVLAEPGLTAVVASGVLLSCVGLVRTGINFVQATESAKDSSRAVYYNAGANAIFSAASFMQGSPVVGAAKACWAVACGLLARMMYKRTQAAEES